MDLNKFILKELTIPRVNSPKLRFEIDEIDQVSGSIPQRKPELDKTIGQRNMATQKGKQSVQHMRKEILRRRYLWKDANGKVVETVGQMFRRVAQHVAGAELNYGASEAYVKQWADVFYNLMGDNAFFPNSPTLMNAGRKNGMLSACFTLPIEDSIDGIFTTVKNTAFIQKVGGGTGFSFDRLRPTGDIVKSSGGRTSGPISFMRVYSEATNAIQQGAFRRGANIGMMSIDHPDILRFIHAKEDLTAFANFNLSVKVPDTFMRHLKDNPDALHIVVNPRTKKEYVIPHSANTNSYSVDDLLPEGQSTGDCYTVKQIWDIIVQSAWATGEPGICFFDRVNEANPTPTLGRIEACNPCGEQPCLPYESCNIGSTNVSRFVDKGAKDVDWDKLKDTIKLAVRFLDNVIDINHYPIPEIEKITLGNRKIGLGIMGFADALILLGIRYDSEEAVGFAEKLASFIQEHAHKASEELAKERACFPDWKGSIWDTRYHRPMRNATCITIAPTGTISIIAEGCSGGIEPIFKIVSRRQALDAQQFIQIHPLLERLGTEQGWLTDRVRDLLAQGVPSRAVSEIPKKLADVLVIAHEIAPEWHVRMQAAFQKYVDNAVSKTVNLLSSATAADVDNIYRLAHQLGCKGITVYRDGCRENQVIAAANQTTHSRVEIPSPRPRPRKTNGSTIKASTGCGSLFVTINRDEKGLFEIFTNLGKAGGCPSQSEATARVLSVALRSGIDPQILIKQLKGIRCLSTIARRKDNKNIDVLSCPDAIARALEAAMGQDYEPVIMATANKCPDCSYSLRREAGCNVCDNCGYSKCG
jgi:ribonucleoside-diphosphate reductase alpha chain